MLVEVKSDCVGKKNPEIFMTLPQPPRLMHRKTPTQKSSGHCWSQFPVQTQPHLGFATSGGEFHGDFHPMGPSKLIRKTSLKKQIEPSFIPRNA